MAGSDYVKVTDAEGYVDPNSGMWVPASAVPTSAQLGLPTSGAAAAKQGYDAPAPTYTPQGGTVTATGDWVPASAVPRQPLGPDYPGLPLTGPMPPQRPSVPLPPVRPSALQRYQAATQPSTFGQTAPLPPPRPQEAGPPMPSSDQMAQLQAQQAPAMPQTFGVPGNSAIADPNSPQNFWRQQMAPTEGTLDNNSGSGLMSLFHNVSGKNPSTGNGAGSNFQWVRPDSIVGKLMSLYNNAGQGKPMDYSDGPLGRLFQQFTSNPT